MILTQRLQCFHTLYLELPEGQHAAKGRSQRHKKTAPERAAIDYWSDILSCYTDQTQQAGAEKPHRWRDRHFANIAIVHSP
jgi:hypothetical protein